MEPCTHVWRDTYGGSECVHCSLFYPSGGAPWDAPIDEPADDTPRGQCEVCGGEWGDGWSSCRCESEPDGPFCAVCGCELERELCDDCDGTGWREYEDDLEYEDPLWYQPGDTERCSACAGKGGWWFCPNVAAHSAVTA